MRIGCPGAFGVVASAFGILPCFWSSRLALQVIDLTHLGVLCISTNQGSWVRILPGAPKIKGLQRFKPFFLDPLVGTRRSRLRLHTPLSAVRGEARVEFVLTGSNATSGVCVDHHCQIGRSSAKIEAKWIDA